MEIDIKNGILVLIMIFLGCIACRDPLFLTEVSGTVNITEECNGDFIFIHESLSNGWVVDSISVSADGTYYAAFAGASLLELRGSELCGSDYYIINRGYRQTHGFTFRDVRSGIEVNLNPNTIHSDIKKLNISLERMLELNNNRLIRIPNDIHNVDIRLTQPLDTLINLTLVDQQFYRLHISGLDSMNISILSIIDTIKVDANLQEILF